MADCDNQFMQILDFCMRRRIYSNQRGEVPLRRELVAFVGLVLERKLLVSSMETRPTGQLLWVWY